MCINTIYLVKDLERPFFLFERPFFCSEDLKRRPIAFVYCLHNIIVMQEPLSYEFIVLYFFDILKVTEMETTQIQLHFR